MDTKRSAEIEIIERMLLDFPLQRPELRQFAVNLTCPLEIISCHSFITFLRFCYENIGYSK